MNKKEKEHKMWKENITPEIVAEIQQAPLKTHIEILDRQTGGCLHLLQGEAIEVMRFLLRIYRQDHTLIPDKDLAVVIGLDLDSPDPERAELRKRTLERAKEIYDKHADDIMSENEKCDRCKSIMTKAMYCKVCCETHVHSFK